MRAVVQRIGEGGVLVDGEAVASVSHGLLVYLGVDRDDEDGDVAYIVDKVRHLRVFSDADDRMNLDVVAAGGEVLVVSAFTVQGDARRGRRPTFDAAARPERASQRYEQVIDGLEREGVRVERGAFGAMMEVRSVNAGPVCILLDSRKAF